MSINPKEFTRPLKPADRYDEHDIYCQYWSRGDDVICGPESAIKGADKDTFVFFLGGFAKDKKHCYNMGRRLAGANPEAFRALNNTYYKDDRFVWCNGGRLNDVDAGSFEVCDDGIYDLDGLPMPHGYGKDSAKVFFYDFNGKPCWVKKADSSTFRSLNDGHFGLDDSFVFCGHATIARADVHTWQKLGGFYSRDKSRIYYFNRVIADADLATFRVIPSTNGRTQLARDSNHFYWNDTIIDHDDYGSKVWLEDAQPDVPGDMPPAARA